MTEPESETDTMGAQTKEAFIERSKHKANMGRSVVILVEGEETRQRERLVGEVADSLDLEDDSVQVLEGGAHAGELAVGKTDGVCFIIPSSAFDRRMKDVSDYIIEIEEEQSTVYRIERDPFNDRILKVECGSWSGAE